MTLCESVGLYVAGKRSFDGCGFRSGCPVVSAHGCDTVNHAAITHAHRHLHGRGAHNTDIRVQKHRPLCACALLLLCRREADILKYGHLVFVLFNINRLLGSVQGALFSVGHILKGS